MNNYNTVITGNIQVLNTRSSARRVRFKGTRILLHHPRCYVILAVTSYSLLHHPRCYIILAVTSYSLLGVITARYLCVDIAQYLSRGDTHSLRKHTCRFDGRCVALMHSGKVWVFMYSILSHNIYIYITYKTIYQCMYLYVYLCIHK